MATPVVVNYRKKIADSSTFLIKITKPIIYSNLAVVDIITTYYGPWITNSNSYLALFKWEKNSWIFITRD
jgi:hypothetical protein